MLQDLSNFIVIESDNPNYRYELYSRRTGVFVCYYIHRFCEGKSLPKLKNREKKSYFNFLFNILIFSCKSLVFHNK